MLKDLFLLTSCQEEKLSTLKHILRPFKNLKQELEKKFAENDQSTIENFAQNDHQHHTVLYSNLLHHVNNPRPVSTLLGLIRRV